MKVCDLFDTGGAQGGPRGPHEPCAGEGQPDERWQAHCGAHGAGSCGQSQVIFGYGQCKLACAV